MRARTKKTGLTLMEMTVVIAGVAMLACFGLPVVRTFLRSFESPGGARAMISSAMASARAIAAKEQHYAGIRFQKAYNPDDPTNAQYMVFILQDPEITGAWGFGFRAVDGLEPIKLPETMGVMDLTIVINRNMQNPVNSTQVRLDDPLLGGDDRINEDFELTDTTTFSIVFSPSGKLVIHGIQVRSRDASDDVFNTQDNVDNAGIGMFYEDDNSGLVLGPEPSRNSFIIYDKIRLRKFGTNERWSKYLAGLETIYINPYTGTMISVE